ncbi:HAD family phosphatase [Proteiniphilum sp. X52]|uniref:HAD family hydrolase n=1 Tax=Proteiniphilum sp. X52 TaxID=2382159 RepID=UPI000F09FCB3|nr:HAD family phosphatase [Proteiniphilum sp. X52]RNC66716.1 HAD family phosphatase [Proteiniphilum sp. X52]
MKPLKNIVFDFGGVLIDWNPIYLYREIFDKEEDMNHFLGHICRYEWNVLQDAGRSLAEGTRVLQEQHPEYREEIAMYYGRWDEMLGGTIEENVKLIKPLKEKYKVYGLTNWSAETIPIAMERYNFFKDLDGMVVSGAEKTVKPDPRLYRILLERYGIQAGESLFIDDNHTNIETAQQLGFQTIHMVDGVNLEEVLKARAIL